MEKEERTMNETLVKWTYTEAVLRDYAYAAEELMKDRLLRDGRVASGYLMDSIATRVQRGASSIYVEMDLAEYWRFVEFDTKPHFPPHLPIFEWVRVKPILPRNEGKIRTRGKKKGIPYTREELQHGIAWAIQHIIGKHGTRGKHTLEETCKALNAEYEIRLSEAIAADLGSVADAVVLMWAK